MNILGIDCSSSVMSVSLKTGNRLFESSVHDGFKHSENLMLQIDQLFILSGMERQELDLIAVCSGPGSFTGLRIAMSTAKGIAMGTDSELISVSTLDTYAARQSLIDGVVIPVIDAKKKRFYAAIYEKGIKVSDEMDIDPEKLLSLVKSYESVLITGPDSNLFTKYAEKDTRILIDKNFTTTPATDLIRIGEKKLQESGSDSHGSGPVYIRKSEAELTMFGE